MNRIIDHDNKLINKTAEVKLVKLRHQLLSSSNQYLHLCVQQKYTKT